MSSILDLADTSRSSTLPIAAPNVGAPPRILRRHQYMSVHGGTPMSRSKIALLVGAAQLVMAALAPVAQAHAADQAQAAAADNAEVDAVVVTGFRKSLGVAREAKKASAIVTDVIVAEDMAKFPDLNLAESLQRLPGVAINREGGEGRRVSLRGLGPDFTRVQLNGMEVLGNVDSPMDSRGQTS
ncbi:MAG: TonB-dependent receptor plug domain-containing protein, partial [Caulobacter sp.]